MGQARRDRSAAARHEAGHAVMALALGHDVLDVRLSRSGSTGVMRWAPAEPPGCIMERGMGAGVHPRQGASADQVRERRLRPLDVADAAPLDLDITAGAAFEVQTDAGVWSREDSPGWVFATWDAREAAR